MGLRAKFEDQTTDFCIDRTGKFLLFAFRCSPVCRSCMGWSRRIQGRFLQSASSAPTSARRSFMGCSSAAHRDDLRTDLRQLYLQVCTRYTPAGTDGPIGHEPEAHKLPGFGVTVFTVLLPVFLMLLKTFADIALDEKSMIRQWLDFIGHPITALLAALLLSLYTFGVARGFNSKEILKFVDESLAPTAAIILIIGAGGGFKEMLVASGVGSAIGQLALQAQISPILLAWLVAGLIRIATGSATVATITGAGIVAPLATLVPGVNRELLVLATGAGSVILSHVNDAGFWLVKQYFNMTVAETFKTWTAMETIVSVVALIFIMILAVFI